ncbi:MAG: arsenate reductase ArsC [Candidatus Omnitrophota bacterium]|nr:arsenate reductase ArsC [Candidatus Omnitrophota bacterium]
MEKLKVLFICRDNAIRSRMAAGFLNTYFGERYEAYSCGISPSAINPRAQEALKEIGIDPLSASLKSIEELSDEKFDCIVTLCDFAKANLPLLPEHRKQLHQGFKDFCLPMLCENAGKSKMCFPLKGKRIEKDTLTAFRYLREEIFHWIENGMVF